MAQRSIRRLRVSLVTMGFALLAAACGNPGSTAGGATTGPGEGDAAFHLRAANLLAYQAIDGRIAVEGSLRLGAGDTGNVIKHAGHNAPAPVERLAHACCRGEITGDGGERGRLRDVAHVRCRV